MTYSSEVLADSPLGYWRLGDTSGTTMTDSSGNGRDGVYSDPSLNATSLLVTDTADKAANFGVVGATARYGRVADAAWMDTTAFTAECWFNVTTTSSYNALVTRDGTPGNRGWNLYILDGKLHVFDANSGGAVLTGSTTISTNTTYHAALVSTGSNVKLYLNGVQDGNVNTSVSNTLTSGGIMVGASVAGNGSNTTAALPATGVIDEAAYYGTALSGTRIADHYAAGTTSGQDIAVGIAERVATALAITIVAGSVVQIGVASRTSEALPVAAESGQTVPIGVASRTSEALSLTTTTGATVAVGVASRTAEALSISTVGGHITVSIGVATRTAEALSITADDGYTDTARNRTSGRQRNGLGSWTWTPPVVPVPDGVAARQGVEYVTALAFDTPTMVNGRPLVSVSSATKPRLRHRILVNNRDVTYERDFPTPELDFQLISPLLYGPGTLMLPQVFAAFEKPGEGDLDWLTTEATVVQQRVDEDGVVVRTDYRGFILAFDTDGAELRCELGGEASGRAALRDVQIPLYRQVKDLGRQVFNLLNPLRVRVEPFLGPETGIRTLVAGGTDWLDHINNRVGQAITLDGIQFDVMPDETGAYRMEPKDLDTIHYTFYPHDAQSPARLRRDITEEPNVFFGTGVQPDGLRVLNGHWPGAQTGDPAPYPFNDGAPFGVGTVDADTDTGDGITTMIQHLRVFGYINRGEEGGGYDADVVEAIESLQEDAGLTVTGIMNQATWRALYNADRTGYTSRWARILPLVQQPYTMPWRRTADGSIIGRNPIFDPTRLPIHSTTDFGNGFEKQQMRKWLRMKRDKVTATWVGTLAFETGALIRGNHTPGNPITVADVVSADEVRPGENIRLPLFMGGVTVHVAGKSVSGGKSTALVDSGARPTMEAWEIVRRNRESRISPQRQFARNLRSSGLRHDSITEFSENGGITPARELVGGQWNVVEVFAGRSGLISWIKTRTNPHAEYVMGIFAGKISEERLEAMIGDPFTPEGKERWTDEDVYDRLVDNHLMIYVGGEAAAPCGYGPKNPGVSAILTGRWEDLANAEYYTGPENVLRVAIFPDRDTTLRGGRIIWPNLSAGA